MRTASLPLCALLAASTALAASKGVKEGDGFRITLGSGWTELADAGKRVTDALPPDVTGGAIAWGDTASGAALQVMWVVSKEPPEKPVREELEAFHAGLRAHVENSGSSTVDFTLTERDNRMTSRHLFESAPGSPEQARISTLQISSAGVSREGPTRSWSAQCAWSTAKGKASCEAALAQFKVTAPAASFRKLPAKEKKR